MTFKKFTYRRLYRLHIVNENKVSNFDLIDNFIELDIKLVSIYLVALFLIFGLLLNAINENFNFKTVARKKSFEKRFFPFKSILKSFNQTKKLNAICIFFIFIHCFFGFTQLFLTNNIKTSKVSIIIKTTVII